MKAIKRVSLVILVVFALSACNDEFDEFNVTQYPSGVQQNDNDITKIEALKENSGSTLDDNIEQSAFHVVRLNRLKNATKVWHFFLSC